MKPKHILLFCLMLVGLSTTLKAQDNRALNFDGTNDAVNLTNGMNTILSTKNTFTAEVWVKPTTNTGLGVIIGNYNNGVGNMQFMLRRDHGNISFWVDCGNGWQSVVANNVVTLNTWMHVAGVWDGSTTKIYINGLLQNTTTGVTGATFVSNTNPIIIGKNNINENFTGDIDDVRLWTVARTATQISENNKKELIGNETGLLAYYKFNNGTANGSNTGVTTLNDDSTNSYNGTLTNFALTGNTSNWVSGAPAVNKIYYVTQTGAGSKDGSNWANASDDIQAMINTANSGEKIFVAKGTYKPNTLPRTTDTGSTLITSTDPRDVTFHLKDGVKIYGGFAGTETGDETTRTNISTTNKTILSGDLGTVNNNTDNAYHVVISVSDSNATVLDGFTITGGNTRASFSDIKVEAKIIFQVSGGGMYNIASSPTITNTTFSGNIASTGNSVGGGMVNDNSSPIITNTTFSGNTSDYGGGMFNASSHPTITNTTFSGNTATTRTGGAIGNENASPKIYNSIFWDNKKGTANNVAGADIDNYGTSSPTVAHCLTQENSEHSTGTGIINNQDPLFVDAANGDFRLQVTSPAINKGNNAPTGVTMPTKDVAGNPRIFQVVDMGAYESQNPVLNPTANVVYVKKGGAGTKDGSSWANAVDELAHALKWASTQATSVTNNLKIYVAKGTYKPMYRADNMSGANANDRDNAFVLKDGVKLYGGFAGTETGDETTRTNISTTNKTTLSSDFNGNDGTTGSGSTFAITNNGENAHHVVIAVDITNTNTTLDGFTITGGNANGSNTITVGGISIFKNHGGGMYNSSSKPTIANTTFSGNTATNRGGGLYNYSSSNPNITNSTFSGNTASEGGGGMYNGDSSPKITNTTFSGNTTVAGGGMVNDNSSPIITNSTFSGNTTHVSFGGGGMYNFGNSSPKIYNSIFWDNKKGTANNVAGADIDSFGSSNPTVKYCLTQVYGTNGTDGNKVGTGASNNPKFVDATNGDFSLQMGSPAINAGTNSSTILRDKDNNPITLPTTDKAGNPRQDGTIDMGAYEFILPKTYYVSETGAGSKDGSNWANASNDLQAMINGARANDKIFVAKGTYKPEYKANAVTGAKTPNDRDNAFVLKDGVQLYGGFAGTETGDETTRTNISNTNKTVLSGDIGTANNNTDNAYHVVISVRDSNATVLDGFTISGGNATGSGIFNVGGNSIRRNSGGGMYNIFSSPSITNSTFSGNTANGQYSAGGGMYNEDSRPKITNSIFSGNTAIGQYSGGGGIYNRISYPTIIHTTFSSNTAANGGAIFNGYSVPKIYNSIFWDNKKGTANNVLGADIAEGFSTVEHCLLQLPKSSYPTSGGVRFIFATTDKNIYNQNPLFVDATNGDFRLQAGSPAINAGDNTKITGITTDANGKPRKYNSTTVDMGAYEHQDEFNYWKGTTDANWATTSNWSKNTVPTNTDTEPAIIKAGGTHMPVISGTTSLSLNNLIVQNGASLTVKNNANLQVSGYARGNITYTRTLPTANWYLVSSPVKGQDIDAFVSASNLKTGKGNNVAFAPYDNNQADATKYWKYYQSGATNSGNFVNGKGYAVAKKTIGDISFTGTMNTKDVSIPVVLGNDNFNLLGNPFISFLNTETILNDNGGSTGSFSSKTVWLWNQSTNTYDTKVILNSHFIAPGQAFFVKAKRASNIVLKTSYQTHQTTNTFQKQSAFPIIALQVKNKKTTRKAEVYFVKGATKGFDNGYDGELFGGVSHSFAVYTDLLASNGKRYQIQSLPLSTMEQETVIPVGVIAKAGEELTFSATAKNLANGLNLFLEDKENGTFTNISDGNYKVVLSKKANGIGRFYIHTAKKALHIDAVSPLSGVSLYKSGAREITISGLQTEKSVITVFDMLGKVVFTSKIGSISNEQKVSLPQGVSSGIYIVELSSKNRKLNKKIVIE